MKYFFAFILITFLTLGFTRSVFAQTKTTTPTNTVTQQQINELQSKIASKVAQLKLVEKQGVLGTVTDSSDTQITLNDANGNIKNIDVDELTKFYSSNTSFGISDIKRGQTLGVLGLYNKDSRRLLAREVNDLSAAQNIVVGVITNTDKANYEITLTQIDKKNINFEIQDTTKTYSYLAGNLTKSGFSKILIGQTAVATGIPDPKSSGKFLTTRVILLPEINLANLLKPASNTIPFASGSGLKFSPDSK